MVTFPSVNSKKPLRQLCGSCSALVHQRVSAFSAVGILTLLKPVPLHALNKMESQLGPLQTCVRMYQSLKKMESLMEESVKSRPASIHKLWFDFRKSSVNFGRFESLTSGFRAQQALDYIDLLLSRHISEISIFFDTLSTNVLFK